MAQVIPEPNRNATHLLPRDAIAINRMVADEFAARPFVHCDEAT
jgi:hypothetical protein